MIEVLTHVPSVHLQDCELTYLESESIDYPKALSQHQAYCQMLKRCGANVDTINSNADLADSVFVEDPIIVFDEVAVLTSMGVESRRPERAAMAEYFSKFRTVESIDLPAEIEGGDVLQIGKKVFVGRSSRTNQAGIDRLTEILQPFGYQVVAVDVLGCLHLKTGVTALDEHTLLINSSWVDVLPFQGYQLITVPESEPFGANIMLINGTVCMNRLYPQTIERVKAKGYAVDSVDISEFVKAEAGLTCMSVRYRR
ncbi:dimethylarginine dimethylaminohydrolase family protein [Celerinatantimonas sp. YJH-8]|uniref:dimethylarginine dimethylaminohydrolase family protein n=1 Tax=Celerinatantimonas sp. YJH-8 TaxID=3228714 RepID=UPI0038CAB9F1